ncbi:MAG TPA: hypothetical protein VH306_03615 [Gaiellaceae bacterium]
MGGIVALLAAGLLAVGGSLLWLSGQRDADGYFTTGPHHFSTPTFAISSNELEIVADAPRWLFEQDRLGSIRIRSAGSAQPIFIGVGPTSSVRKYLADVPHEVATDVGTRPFDVTYTQAIGSSPPKIPLDQSFWAASTIIRGTGAVSWDVKPGKWSVVVMNADGSAAVDAKLELGAKVGFLEPAGWGLTGAGALLLVAGLAALAVGLRGRSGHASPPPPPTIHGVPERDLQTLGAERTFS